MLFLPPYNHYETMIYRYQTFTILVLWFEVKFVMPVPETSGPSQAQLFYQADLGLAL